MLPSTGQTHTHTHTTHTHTHKDFYTNCLMFKRKTTKTKWKKQENVKGIEIFTLKCVVQCKYKMARDSVHQRHAI